MKLHYHPLSPYSRKVSTAIAMRGDPIELVSIRLGTNALATPEFLAISPFGKIPVLETESGPIIESTSIIEYLEEQGPRCLLPVGSERTARHFDRLGDHYLIATVAKYFWARTSSKGKEAPDTARKAWGLFATELRGRKFVCGDDFSLGDLGAAIATDYFEREGLELPGAIRDWKNRCFEIRAMADSLAAAVPFVESTKPMRLK